MEREIDDELRFHVERRTDDLVAAGMTPAEASRRARVEFGGVEAWKEPMREAFGLRVIDEVGADLRYAFRQLRHAPGFASVAILSLSLGIGANTAIFSLINTLSLRVLPVHEPEQLVQVLSSYPGEPRILGFSWKYYEDYRDRNRVFSDLIGVSATRFQVSGTGVQAATLAAEYVPGNFFQALGLKAAVGRLIDPQDDQLGAASASVAVVSWPYWKSRFNLDPAIPGRQIVLDGASATVIGVAPREFSGLQVGLRSDVWVPAAMEPLIRRPSQRADGSLGMTLMGRLKPGVSIEQAREDMRRLDQRRIDEVFAKSKDPLWRQVKIDVEPAAAGFSVLRDQFGRPLFALMAIVGLLLCIACTNVASMLLARGASRRREMAVRISLGAGPLRLVRQALTESLLLSAMAGLLGIVLAYFGADALVRIIASGRPLVGWPGPIDIQVRPDTRLLMFTAAVATLTALLFGLAPAWNAAACAPASSLREAGTGETRSRRFLGKILVVGQVALSVVLLTGGGLFIGHLSNLSNVDLGFRRDSVLLVVLNPQGSGYNRVQLTRLYQELLRRLQMIPGVRSVSLSGTTPIEGGAASRFGSVEGYQERPEDRRYLMLNWVGPKYFETLGTPLVAGRDFEFEDGNRTRVAIVNQTMARHYFRGTSPVGRHVTFDGDVMPYEIVGVVADAKYVDLHEPAPRTVYLNAFQEGRIGSQFALRTSVVPSAVAGEVRRTVGDVVKNVRIAKMTTLAEQLDASIVPERLVALLSGFFGALGALLAAIGLYGLLAYSVARRTSEIGLRIALGATRRDVTIMIVKGALGLVCAGLAIGVPIAWSSRSLVASVMQNVSVRIDVPLAVAAVTLIGIALLAACLPARRAARVHPTEALRHS